MENIILDEGIHLHTMLKFSDVPGTSHTISGQYRHIMDLSNCGVRVSYECEGYKVLTRVFFWIFEV